VAVAGGWKLSGSKLWTSHAHRAQYAIVLARSGSGPLEADRHAGLTQFLVDMSSPGVTPRPIADLTGGRDFNEVVLDEVFVPDEAVLGQPDEGWSLVMGELAWERSGPERFLSSQPLLEVFLALVRQGAVAADDATVRTLGAQAARLAVLRQMSLSLAHQLERGDRVDVEAALVKDVGATYERAVPDAVRTLAPDALDQLPQLGAALLAAPSYSLRGGTREILRGIIAKRLEVR
jgi:alkylation response protein AidB-like acyl-CoA dehydrogenase